MKSITVEPENIVPAARGRNRNAPELLDCGLRTQASTLSTSVGRWPQTCLIPLAIALATFLLYWPALSFDFVQYDDNDYVFDNQTVRAGLTWGGIVWSFIDAHALNWHPITWLSHMLDCQFFGLNPRAHHLVNVLLHCVNAALVFILLHTLTGSVWRSSLVGALFAWHPLRVESVAWISERKDVLSGFFFLLTLLMYARYVQAKNCQYQTQGGSERLERRSGFSLSNVPSFILAPAHRLTDAQSYALSLTFFTLGLLSKPMLVTVPFLLLLLDLWPLQRLRHKQGPGAQHRVFSMRELVSEKLPFFALALCIAIITFHSQRSGGAVVSLEAEGMGTRIGTALAGYLGYMEKTFWPSKLTVIYLRPAAISLFTIIPGMVLLIAATRWSVSSSLGLRRSSSLNSGSQDFGFGLGQPAQILGCKPAIAVGWLWFVFMLLPVCGLVQVGPQLIADRYTYLPSIGLAILVAWALPLPKRFSVECGPAAVGDRGLQTKDRSRTTFDYALWTLVLALLVTCAILTRHQLRYWRNTDTLMTHALAVDPNNYIAHQDLAVYYAKHGQIDAARVHRQKVRELDPSLR